MFISVGESASPGRKKPADVSPMYRTTMDRGSTGAEYIASKGVVDIHGRDINNVSRETVSHVTRMEQFMTQKTKTSSNRRSIPTNQEARTASSKKDDIRKFTIFI